MKTLASIHIALKKGGILIFDNFNAEKIISLKKKKFIQRSKYKETEYKRVSEKTLNLKTGWTENWTATYFIKEKGQTIKIKDTSIVRSFTEDELNLFLQLNHFNVIKSLKKDVSIISIAKKI